MRSFDKIFQIAADRKGGADALEGMLKSPVPVAELAARPASDWLQEMARAVFQAGFSWTVIENKWPGFRAAFDEFDVDRVAFYHDEDMDRLLADTGIVRNGRKIQSVIDNAPSSKTAMKAVQGAFNDWQDQSGRPMTQISQVLAMSVG